MRWQICLLLFFATTINYLDRQLFALLVPFFEDELRIGPVDLALINVSFLLAYGFGMVGVGRWVDRVGVGRGLATSFLLWNLASAAHGLITSVSGFLGIRFLLGLGESGNFPAAVKTVSEWFPAKERALATGWFNSGSNIGAILAPILAILLAQVLGWRACFLTIGAIGLVWLYFWRRFYHPPEEHPNITADELAYIRQDQDGGSEKMGLTEVFGLRPVYGVAVAKFLTDAPWWFYLTWLPKFLTDEFRLSPTFMSVSIPIVFLLADVGAVGGGWLSSRLISRGRPVGWSRKMAMLICGVCALPVMAVGALADIPNVMGIPTIFIAIALISLAAAAHQGWSSNLFTLVSDTLPRQAIATTVGIKTAFGVVGGALFQVFVGFSVAGGSYVGPFILAGSLYLVGLAMLHLILPTVEKVTPRKRAHPMAIGIGAVAMLAAVAGLQITLNRPKYSTLNEYEAKRSAELNAVSPPEFGPVAKVGWMEARWVTWETRQGTLVELIKFDRDQRPIVEPKGVSAKSYAGPPAPQP